MSSPSPERLTDRLWRAAITVLAAAVGLYVGWQLLRPLVPAIVVLVALLFIYRLALGLVRSHRDW